MTFDNLPRVDKAPDPFSDLQSRLRDPKRLEAHASIKASEVPPRLLARVTMSGAQTLADTTTTTLIYDTVEFDYGGLYGAGTGKFTVPAGKTTGLWAIHGHVIWNASATGQRRLILRKNLTTLTTSIHPVSSATANTAHEVLAFVLDPVAGDQFYIDGFQTSGGNLGLFSEFELIHIW